MKIKTAPVPFNDIGDLKAWLLLHKPIVLGDFCCLIDWQLPELGIQRRLMHVDRRVNDWVCQPYGRHA